MTVSGATLDSDSVVNRNLMTFEGVAGTVTSDAITNTNAGIMAFETDVEFALDDNTQTFDNQGLVDINSGTLTFRNGKLAHSGVLDIAAGAELAIDVGTLSMQSGGVLTGEGVISFSSALEIASGVEFTNSTGIPSLVFENGDLIGAGSFVNQALLSMSSGTIGVASFTNDVGGVLQADNGSIEFDVDSVFTSRAGATLSILSETANAAIVLPSGFSNAGLISFAGTTTNAGTTTDAGTLNVGSEVLANQSGGEIALVGGVHEITGAVDNRSGATVSVSTGGLDSARLSVGGELINVGIVALNATGGLGGSATLDVTGGILTNNTLGSIQFGGTEAADLLAIEGDINNQGSILAASAADSRIGGAGSAIENAGTLTVASSSSLTIGEANGAAGGFDNSGIVALDGDLVLRNTLFQQNTGVINFGGGTFVLSEGGTFELGSDFTLDASGTLALDSGGAITAINGSSAMLDNQGNVVFNGGVFDVDAVNFGTLSTVASSFEISGSLSNVDAGTLALDDSKTLTGGGTIEFQNDADLTADTIDTATTVSVSDIAPPSDPLLTVSNTTVDGVLVANSGVSVAFDGSLQGDGTFLHDADDSTLNQAISVANFENTGTLTLSGGTLASATASNAELVVVADDSLIDPGAGGTFTNSGDVEIADDFALTFGDGFEDGVLLNTGLIDLSESGTLAIGGGILQNNGSLSLNADTKIVVDSGTLAGTDTLTITGTLSLENDGALAQAAVNEGTLTTNNDSYNLQGVLSTTDAGTILLSGSKTLTGGGTLEFLIDLDLSGDTVGTATTVSVSDSALPTDPILTISNTTVDGLLIATESALVTFDGSLSGDGTFRHGAEGSTLTHEIDVATLENTGTLTLSNGTLASAEGINSGLLVVETDSLVDPGANETFTNSGRIEIQNAATMAFGDATDGGQLTNESDGTLDIVAGGTLSLAGGVVQNDGALALAGVLEVGGDAVFQQNVDFILNDGSAIALDAGTLTGTETLTNNGAVSFANQGVLAIATVNEGTLTTANNRYDVSGSLSTTGSGTIVLDGVTTLDGGGTFGFSNTADLSQEIVAVGTTVSVADDATVTVSDTTVGGILDVADGAGIALDGGTLGGTGILTLDGELSLENNGVLSLSTVNEGTLTTTDNRYDVSSSLSTTGAGTIALDGINTLDGGGTFAFDNSVDLTNDIVAVDTEVSIADGGAVTISNTDVDGLLTVVDGASLSFGGLLTGDGTFDHAAIGTTLTTLVDIATLTNSGTLALDGGTLASGNATNSGLLVAAAGTPLLDPAATGTLTNSGIIDIENDVVLTFGDTTDDGLLRNSGTIDLSDSGTLSVAGGSLGLTGAGTLIGGGEARFVGDLDIGAGVSLNLSAVDLVFEGGGITGDGAFSTDANVAFTTNGEIAVADFRIGTTGVLDASAGAVDVSAGTLENSGNIVLTDAVLSAATAVLTNTADGTITAGAGTGAFDIAIDNSGDIALSGAVRFDKDIVNAGGTISIGDGAEAIVGSTLNFAGGTITGDPGTAKLTLDGGTLALQSNFILDSDLSLAVTDTAANALSLDTLSFTNDGVVDIAADAALSVTASGSGAFVKQGTLQIGAGGSITASGATIANTGGTLEIGADFGIATIDGNMSFDRTSTFNVDLGGLIPGTQFDQLTVDGDLALGGTLGIKQLNGFVIADSQSFEIVSVTGGGTLSGSFDSVGGLEASDTFVLDLAQSDTGLTLTSIAVDPTGVGTDNVDTLTGGTTVDVLLGKDGNDTLSGGGGRDHLFGGGGDDTFTDIDASFAVADDASFGRLDGGGDFDLVDFTGDTGSFNLRQLRGDQLSGIKKIDIAGAGTVTLSLDAETVLSATDGENALTTTENALIIDGDNGNVLNIVGGDWNGEEATVAALDGYTVYQDASTEAQIFIKDTDIGINFLP